MAAPILILSELKNILRIPDTDTTFDVRLEGAYQRALTELTRETDLFAHVQQIPVTADQSIYTAATGTTRILAVLHNRTLLGLVPSRSLDLLTTWQTDEAGEPEEFTMDKLPNSASPLNFAVHPAPAVDASGDEGITIIRIGTPVNDDPPKHCYPLLIYRTAAIFSTESTEDRDPAGGEFWGALADIWKELITA